MIIDNGNGTYTVKIIIDGNMYADTFDELYEAEACQEQYNMVV